ncbi:MAG: hypothetical protein WCE30_12895 [Mycobacterium sp.]
MELQRLAEVLGEVMTVVEDDDALTVTHGGMVASLRVVDIADGLQMVSLTQPLAWDLKLDNSIRDRVIEHAGRTMLGTVVLAERSAGKADVMLRYNFPAAGLADAPLQTLIMLVLSMGADVRADLTS